MLLLDLQILWSLNTSQTQALLDSLHPLAVLNRDGGAGSTEVDVQLLQGLVLGLGDHEADEETTNTTEGGEEDVGTELMLSSMSLVVRPMMKLNIQLVEATMETPRERMELGKISCVSTHATGPQE